MFICMYGYLCLCMSICPYAYLSICLSIYLSICLCAYIPINIFFFASALLSFTLYPICSVSTTVHLSGCHLSGWLSVHFPTCSSVCMTICPFFYVFIYLSDCLSVWIYKCFSVHLFSCLFIQLSVCHIRVHFQIYFWF
jgi:hypothetical protein